MHKNFIVSILAAIFVSIPGVALAVPAVPTSAQPGVVMRNIEEEQREPSTIKDIVVVKESQADGKDLSDKKVFTLTSVTLLNSTVYDKTEVYKLVKGYLGKEVSFADLNAISNILTKKYRDDGYIFSRVILAPQKISEGHVHFKAIEGKISDVKVNGNYKDKNGLINDYVQKIKSEKGPSNSKTIERYLLLINDLPGIKARSLFQPSATPDGVDMIIDIEEKALEGSASIDNRGSKYLGPLQGSLLGVVNSAFGIHDRTTIRGINTSNTDELRFIDISHEEQVGTEGAKITGRYAYTKTKPGSTLTPLDSVGTSSLFDLEALYPLVRSRQYNINVIGGFNLLDAKSDILGGNVSDDRVRTVRAGGRFDFTDSMAGINQAELIVTQGLDTLGATQDGAGRTHPNANNDFTRVNSTVTRIQDLTNNFSVKLSGSGQYSNDPLLVSEQFSLGGAEFGRAYDSGELTGDRGIAGIIEFRYGEDTMTKILKSYQLYTFYDAGEVWNRDVVVGELPNATLTSAGVGVRFNLAYDFSGDLQLSKPLTRDVAAMADRDPRVFFSLTKRF